MPIPSRLENLSILFLALVMPLSFYSGAEDAYRLVQLAALSLGVAGLLAGLAWSNIRPNERDLHEAHPAKPHLLDILVVAFFFLRILSRLRQGMDPQVPLFLAEQFAYLSIYAWASWRLVRQDPERRLVAFLLLGAGLAAVYGLVQTMGMDPYARLAAPTGFGARSYSSLGNPDFFGGHLVLLIPLVLGPWLRESARGRRWAWATIFLTLLVLSLLLSQTRGAWLGFCASAVILLAARRTGLYWKRAGGLLAAGLLVFALFSFPNFVNRPGLNLLGRLAGTFSKADSAGSGRLFMAKAAWRAACAKPLLGWGAGKFTGAYLEIQSDMLHETANAGQPFRFTNDAHNDFLQLAAESGFPCLALFLAVLSLACIGLWKAKTAFSVSVLAGVLGLTVHGFFNFPLSIVPTTAFFWLFLGWSGSLAKAGDPLPAPVWSGGPRLRTRATLVAAAMGLVFCFVVLRAIFVNTVYHEGMNRAAANQPALAQPFFMKALNLDRGDYRHWFQAGRAADALGRPEQAKKCFLEAVNLFPEYPEAWSNLGLAQGKLGDYALAEASCKKALDLNPRSLETLANLGKVHYLMGKKKEAVGDYLQGLQLRPNWAEGCFNLGAVYYNEGNKKEARVQFEAALKADPNHAGARAMLEKMKGKKVLD